MVFTHASIVPADRARSRGSRVVLPRAPDDLAFLGHVTPVRGQLVNGGLAKTEMGDRAALGETVADGLSDPRDHAVLELDIAKGSGDLMLFKQTLCDAIGVGRVVLVKAGQQHPVLGCSRGRGQFRSPALVGLVADFAPVDGGQ